MKKETLWDKLKSWIRNPLGFRKKQKESAEWFVKEIKSSVGDKANPKWFNPVKDPFIGGLFHWRYQAKTADKLPYWDAWPLVIPLAVDSNHILGLNLHYLPPELRTRLLDFLLELRVKVPRKDDYMRVSYSALKSSAMNPLMSVCIKKYLISHIRSKFIKVDPEHWEKVCMLPTQQFQKASETVVWSDSKRRIRASR